MGGKVFRSDIGLDLYEAAPHESAAHLTYKNLAEQVARDDHGLAVEKRCLEDPARGGGVGKSVSGPLRRFGGKSPHRRPRSRRRRATQRACRRTCKRQARAATQPSAAKAHEPAGCHGRRAASPLAFPSNFRGWTLDL